MKKVILLVGVVFLLADITLADIFGTGANQFTIEFVNISGDTNPASGYGVVSYDYRIGTYEITNDQWNKFTSIYGTPTGNPLNAYDQSPHWTDADVPTNNVSWYEAAQFVNYLNASTGHSEAYKFTGIQGTGDYHLAVWESGEVGYDSSNPYRNSNAYYFLPTEAEWVKAAYWNGINLQTYATTDDSTPTAGVDSNYDSAVGQPWDVNNGSEELNGTFNMMGNVSERIESPYSGTYETNSFRVLRGGAYGGLGTIGGYLASSDRFFEDYLPSEKVSIGFRVASFPELGSAYHVDGINGSDDNDGLSVETAFASIQYGIDAAEDGDSVFVLPDVYFENIVFDGKAITVSGFGGVPVIDGDGYWAVSIFDGEGLDTVLKNVMVTNSYMGIFISGSSPTIQNVNVIGNMFGIEAYSESVPDIVNCILWDNADDDLFGCQGRYCNIQRPAQAEGIGNINEAPLFVDAGAGDYRLLSHYGRYMPSLDLWVADEVTSACINAGDPAINPADETEPNGGRINIGAYGGTAEASRGLWALEGDINQDGRVDLADFAILAANWLGELAWMQQ